MDLLRTALGLHRGSLVMAKRFEQEAIQRSKELELENLRDPYLKRLITQINKSLIGNSDKKADELLMYSVLFKNFIAKQAL